jgi:hypothetical protein
MSVTVSAVVALEDSADVGLDEGELELCRPGEDELHAVAPTVSVATTAI